MKYKFLLLNIVPLLFFTACHSEEIDALKKEIFELRTEIRELAQIKYEVEELKKNQRPKEPIPSNDAVIEKTLKSTGSELDDPFLGEKNAEYVVMFFSDYQCKLCNTFIQTNLERIKQNYITNKKIKFIYRDHPLSTNPQSINAANFANCAGEQGKYWQASNALIENQQLLEAANFSEIAKKIKDIDSKKLIRCANRSRYEKEIELDRIDAKQLGITGIPSFFIGKISNAQYAGYLVRGAQPYNIIKTYLNKVLESE